MRRKSMTVLVFTVICATMLSCSKNKSQTDNLSNDTELTDSSANAFGAFGGATSDESSSDAVGEETSTTSEATDVDEYLDSYDRYMTKAISIMKKVNAGDQSVLSEYAELMQELNDLQEKGENLKSEFTSAQLKRYTKIVAKMAKLSGIDTQKAMEDAQGAMNDALENAIDIMGQ